MNPILKNAFPEFAALMQKYNIEKAYAFGSVSNETFSDLSDLDFLVSFKNDLSAEDYSDCFFNLKFGLEKLFGREIDLLTEASLRNPYLKNEIVKSRQLIYG